MSKIWDDETKRLIDDDYMEKLNEGFITGGKLMQVAGKLPFPGSYKTKVIQAQTMDRMLAEETKQKETIMEAIVKLRLADKLSEEEFKLLLLEHSLTSKF